MKVGIVGTGAVGSSAAFAIVMNAAANDLVLVDYNERLACAQAEDILHATSFLRGARVKAGGYQLLRGCDVVVLSCGVSQKPGEPRMDLLNRNADVFRQVVPQVLENAPQAILVVATNPVDVMAQVVCHISAQACPQVIGTGTLLDTARFRALLGEHLGVSPQWVHAYVLGEHGESEVLVWSSVTMGGVPLEQFSEQVGRPITDAVKDKLDKGVRGAAARIIEGKGFTNYGIGAGIAYLIRIIRDNARAVLTLSAPIPQSTDYDGTCFSLPRVIGDRGIEKTLFPSLSQQERTALQASANIIKEAARSIL